MTPNPSFVSCLTVGFLIFLVQAASAGDSANDCGRDNTGTILPNNLCANLKYDGLENCNHCLRDCSREDRLKNCLFSRDCIQNTLTCLNDENPEACRSCMSNCSDLFNILYVKSYLNRLPDRAGRRQVVRDCFNNTVLPKEEFTNWRSCVENRTLYRMHKVLLRMEQRYRPDSRGINVPTSPEDEPALAAACISTCTNTYDPVGRQMAAHCRCIKLNKDCVDNSNADKCHSCTEVCSENMNDIGYVHKFENSTLLAGECRDKAACITSHENCPSVEEDCQQCITNCNAVDGTAKQLADQCAEIARCYSSARQCNVATVGGSNNQLEFCTNCANICTAVGKPDNASECTEHKARVLQDQMTLSKCIWGGFRCKPEKSAMRHCEECIDYCNQPTVPERYTAIKNRCIRNKNSS